MEKDRELAEKVLIKNLSVREGFLIEEISTLPERLIDAMIEYSKVADIARCSKLIDKSMKNAWLAAKGNDIGYKEWRAKRDELNLNQTK